MVLDSSVHNILRPSDPELEKDEEVNRIRQHKYFKIHPKYET